MESMETVFVLEELTDILNKTRYPCAVFCSFNAAKDYINNNGGNQLIMLADGSIIEQYEINECVMMNNY